MVDEIIGNLEKKVQELEIERQTFQNLVETERKKSISLTARTLPKHAADLVAAGKPVDPCEYKGVSVLSANVTGLDALANDMTATEMAVFLDDFGAKVNEIIATTTAIKIEQNGAYYLMADGIPNSSFETAIETVNLAMEMINCVCQYKVQVKACKEALGLKCGIHIGTVIASVAGTDSLHYSVVGEAVGIAKKLEHLAGNCEILISNDFKIVVDRSGQKFNIEKKPNEEAIRNEPDHKEAIFCIKPRENSSPTSVEVPDVEI